MVVRGQDSPTYPACTKPSPIVFGVPAPTQEYFTLSSLGVSPDLDQQLLFAR